MGKALVTRRGGAMQVFPHTATTNYSNIRLIQLDINASASWQTRSISPNGLELTSVSLQLGSDGCYFVDTSNANITLKRGQSKTIYVTQNGQTASFDVSLPDGESSSSVYFKVNSTNITSPCYIVVGQVVSWYNVA